MMDGRAREWLEAGGFFDWAPQPPMGSVDELKIFHAEFGDPEAPTLLLLHGFPTSSIDWYDVVEALGKEHRVCVLDFPGFGFSDKPKAESYTLARDCELVAHYLDEVVGCEPPRSSRTTAATASPWRLRPAAPPVIWPSS